jgi:hypothetical protein
MRARYGIHAAAVKCMAIQSMERDKIKQPGTVHYEFVAEFIQVFNQVQLRS